MALMEPLNRDFWRAVTAECLAIFLFVFVGVGCALSTLGIAEGAAVQARGTATLAISLCFGLMIFVLAHCFGHISGAHINPAVTFALALARQVTVVRAVFYMLAHIIGSLLGTAMLMICMGLKAKEMGGFNALSGADDNKILRGFSTELILTFLLCFTVLATVDPGRAETHMAPLAIGMAVGVAHLIAVPITGCGINPARSLGPGLLADNERAREDLWVFLLAPFCGAALAALLYPFWFAQGNFHGGLMGKFKSKDKVEAFEGGNEEPV